MRISAVIPVYNSAGSLREVVARLGRALPAIADDYEVILVNDGSRDSSWKVVVELARSDPRVRGLSLSRNFGQHNAVLCGVREARYETIVTLDDDLQHPPEEIHKLLAALDSGFEVAYGVPDTMQHGAWRNFASRLTKFAIKTSMGVAAAPDVSAFRAFRAKLRDSFADFRGSYVSLDVLLSWGTTRFTAVKVRHDERTQGKSNYTFGKLVVHAVNMMTGYSTLPLRLASLMGFAFTVLGILVLFYVIGRYFLNGMHSIPGFPFLASTIALFAGAQLFALGIIGEYLARVHLRTMDRPPYVISARASELDP